MKYIFLDIDGPINTGRNDYYDPERNGHPFDDMAVSQLRRIVSESGAAIIISSSWRHMGLDRLRELWREWTLPGHIAGATPGVWGDGTYYRTRGEEIRQWLSENARPPFSFVVIDDMGEGEALDDQKESWVKVNPHCGISEEDADMAIRILGGNEP
jgi:hypothetical protein